MLAPAEKLEVWPHFSVGLALSLVCALVLPTLTYIRPSPYIAPILVCTAIASKASQSDDKTDFLVHHGRREGANSRTVAQTKPHDGQT